MGTSNEDRQETRRQNKALLGTGKRWCLTCRRTLSEGEFWEYAPKNGNRRFEGRCKACANEVNKAKQKARRAADPKRFYRRNAATFAAGVRHCSLCRQDLPIGAFGRHKASPDGYTARCRECIALARRESKYGLVSGRLAVMVAAQRGLCATCHGALGVIHVDHCHVTGKVRGLLCFGCNVALGAVCDDTATLGRMVAYLTHYAKPGNDTGTF